MKYGIRKPSINKRISARTTGKITRSVKRAVNPMYGKSGMGFLNDPKKALYNKVYNKTTKSIDDIIINIANGIIFGAMVIGIIIICVIASWIF